MRQLVVTATPEMPVALEALRLAVGEEYAIVVLPLPFGEMSPAVREPLWQTVASAEALLVRTGVIPRELILRCPRLKIIAVHGAGVDQVDVLAAKEAGIVVANVPGGNAQTVAEFTFGLLLSLLRQIPRADKLVRLGQWEGARTVGRELAGKRLGLVGFGHIGQKVAGIAHAFGMEVVYYARGLKESSIAKAVSLEELFSTSQVVSLHLPLTPATHGLIDARLLSLMPREAVLINTARGAIVVEARLVQALREQWFAGAALDVFAAEPLPRANPLLKLPNVLITPHMGGSSQECLERIARTTGQDIRAFFEERPLRHALNDTN